MPELRAQEPGAGRSVGAPAVRQLPQAAALEKVATEMAGKIKLVKVNVDEAPRLQQRFGVQAIPTLLLLRKGEVIARQVGAVPEQAIKAWVNGALQPG